MVRAATRSGTPMKCARDAPQKHPEEHRKQHHERRDRQRRAGNARLEVASDQKLDEIEAHEDDDRHLPGFGLRNGEQGSGTRSRRTVRRTGCSSARTRSPPTRSRARGLQSRRMPKIAKPVMTLIAVRTSMYRRNLAAIVSQAFSSDSTDLPVAQACELSSARCRPRAGPACRNIKVTSANGNEAMDASGELLKGAQQPIHVEILGA